MGARATDKAAQPDRALARHQTPIISHVHAQGESRMTPSTPFSLDGRTALITGSTKGIGRAIAAAFAAAGARVWLHGRDQEAGERLAGELGARFVAADLAEADGPSALAQQVLEAEDRLDILVNNAGTATIQPLERLNLPEIDRTWQLNLRAPVQLTSALLPLLREAAHVGKDASVINISSIHETVPAPGNVPYAMTKAALAMYTKGAAVEWGRFGVRVNTLAPGAVKTNMMDEYNIGEEHFAKVARRTPLGRMGEVTDITGPALFLASAASCYVTGTTVTADGGSSLNLVRYGDEWVLPGTGEAPSQPVAVDDIAGND
ncbi:SDR family NAD(P)-dependent oxidoreductase [Streptomyces sp. NPDC101150]|uniref:SDR family NAD(P)-dependent oxidoreductase n=1 Tax=Streptomyces sp. NPDC101150 TaxID=3366114 RepID=UPI0037FF948A